METRQITSASNPLIRQVADIARRSHKADQSLFIAEGTHLVEAAIEAAAPLRWLFFSPEYGQNETERELLLRAEEMGGELIQIPDHLLKRISDTENPQGILAVVATPESRLDAFPPVAKALLAICDAIRDPGNLGTIIRIADAAGADAVILLPGCCDPYAPKVVRATAGSLFHLPLIKTTTEELIVFLNERGIALLATDPKAQSSLYGTDLTLPCALAIGNESQGVSPLLLEKARLRVKIPMPGKAESLNAAVSAALCLFEAVRQRNRVL